MKGVNLDALNAKLDQLMEADEIFTDETISLPQLARKVNVSPHQLSQFINENKGDNFSAFINRYRVRKAQAMLIAEPDKKILAVAYDVGFQSPNVEAAKPMVYTTALLLILIVVILNIIAIYMRNRLRKKYKTSVF